MITKEQAMQLKHGDYVYQTSSYVMDRVDYARPFMQFSSGKTESCAVRRWKITTACKTWKRDTSRFRLGLKFGLYEYGELTQENSHLFHLEMPE
jgi:hypothetical protein